jgi:hypothetical protein
MGNERGRPSVISRNGRRTVFKSAADKKSGLGAEPTNAAKQGARQKKKSVRETFFTQERPKSLPESGLSFSNLPDTPGKLKVELICALLAARLWDEPWRMRDGPEGLRLLALEVLLCFFG